MKKNKNSKLLSDFIKYSISHPDERFWQALRNWAKVPFILKSSHFDADMFDEKWIKKYSKKIDISDTFYE